MRNVGLENDLERSELILRQAQDDGGNPRQSKWKMLLKRWCGSDCIPAAAAASGARDSAGYRAPLRAKGAPKATPYLNAVYSGVQWPV
jgi:hypothetical protein